jgi:putative hemolysin
MPAKALWYGTKFALKRLPSFIKLKKLEENITPSIKLFYENDNYCVKTADTADELGEILRLRFQVFFKEFSTRSMKLSFVPYDVDKLDFICDHLIVVDKRAQKIVACYRLVNPIQRTFLKRYYTESEFILDEFLKIPGAKLELGRACVHPDYRSGTVIGLLLAGLLEYARKGQIDYLFGCSSINATDFAVLDQTKEFIEEHDSYIKDYNVGIQKKYQLSAYPQIASRFNTQVSKSDKKPIGSLLYMYMMAGAKLSRDFAYDPEMDCLDIFTVVDTRKIPDSFNRRFSFK